MGKDATRLLSRTVQTALENTPENLASLRDEELYTTWGHLASQVMEAEVTDPNIDSVVSFLGISRQDLVDPKPQNLGANNYKFEFLERARQEYIESRKAVVQSFIDEMVDFAITRTSFDDPNNQETFDSLSYEIPSLKDRLDGDTTSDPTRFTLFRKLAEAQLERDSVWEHGKLDISFAEFTAKILGTKSEDELGLHIRVKTLNEIIETLSEENAIYLDGEEDYSSSPADTVPITLELFKNFIIGYIANEKTEARLHATIQWKKIKHFVIPKPYWKLPLFVDRDSGD